MNNKEFIAALASNSGLTVAEAQRLADDLVAVMTTQLENGNPIQVAGLGTFDVKKRMEKEMVSPSTGKRMLVPPKLVVAFKPIATLKDSVRKGGVDDGEDA